MELPAYQIRHCDSLSDFSACLTMQREVWQFADVDVTPVRAFVVAKNSGGFTLGAFAENDGQLLGFAHALAAFDEQLQPYYYSQMLAIHPGIQNSGLGMQLKFAQRNYALQQGVKLMVWTFDPLQSRNAYLNLVKLGGVVRKYYVNYYGDHSSSVLHRGLATDRLLLEWWLDSPRVRALVEASPIKPSSPAPQATVEVPFNIDALKDENIHAAQNWQIKIRTALQSYFSQRLVCAGFMRGNQASPSQYLLCSESELLMN